MITTIIRNLFTVLNPCMKPRLAYARQRGSPPASILHINTGGANRGIRVTDGTVTGLVYASSLLTNSYAFGTESNHPMILGTNNTWDRLVITSTAGNVGIGTTAPGARLEVAGTETNDASAIQITNTTATTGKGWKIISKNNGTADIVAEGSPDKIIATMGVK